jgi:hypothetical protein
MPSYSYADITLSSTFPMAGLLAVTNEQKSPDITFQIMSSPPAEPAGSDWIHVWHTTTGEITLLLAGIDSAFLLRFPFLADFVLDETGCRIGAWPAPETDEETVRHLLLDQVMPRVLGHQGRLVLHASAVCVEGRALAFVGETGMGKSTLAASFHLSGYPLLTDDGLVVKREGDCIEAMPGYSGLRLLPESVTALFKEPPPGKAMAAYSPKNRVALDQNYKIDSVELAALFVLGKPDLGEETAAIKVSPLSQRDACMELVRNSFQLDVSNHNKVAALFSAATEAAKRLPVFSLSYPRDFSSLPGVHKAIMNLQRESATEVSNDLRAGEPGG